MEKKRIDGLDVLNDFPFDGYITLKDCIGRCTYFFNNQWDVVVEKEYVFFETTL